MSRIATYQCIIEADKTEIRYWEDVWIFRGLFYFLAWKDILIRYKQTVLGMMWALLQPLLMMIVFSIIFGKIAHLPANNVPYPLLVFSAMLPWQFFALSFSESGNCLVNNSSMITKVYFPRIILPVSTLLVCMVDLLIAFCLLALLMVFYHVSPSIQILFLPIFFFLLCICALGGGLWIAALNVKYRDFRFIIPFIVQMGLYISPVGFTSNLIPEKWRLLYSINPLVGIIDGFRWTILGDSFPLFIPGFLISMSTLILLFGTGLFYFRKTEKFFADVI